MNDRLPPSPRLEPLPPEHTPQLAEFFEVSRQRLGFIPNSLRIMQRRPDIVKAFSQLTRAVWAADSTVDPSLKRMVEHISSRAAGCRYCMAHTAGGTDMFGLDKEKVAAMWDYQTSPLFSEAERAALDFALAAGSVPNNVTDEMFAKLREHFSEEQIVELTAAVARMGFLNRWNDTMATPLEDEPMAIGEELLAPRGWTPGKHRESGASEA